MPQHPGPAAAIEFTEEVKDDHTTFIRASRQLEELNLNAERLICKIRWFLQEKLQLSHEQESSRMQKVGLYVCKQQGAIEGRCPQPIYNICQKDLLCAASACISGNKGPGYLELT